jgi:hypothetical protein
MAMAAGFLKPSRWRRELEAVAKGSFEGRQIGGEGATRALRSVVHNENCQTTE